MGCITMITSGRYGTGKSTVAALLGETLASQGKSVLIVELSNQPGCMDIFTSSGSVLTDLGDIFYGRSTPAQAVSRSSLFDTLDVIYSSHGRSSFSLEKMVPAIAEFSKMYDHVLVDTDCSDKLTDAVAKVAMNSIVISPPDPLNLRDCKVLCDRLNAAGTPGLRLLINRVTRDSLTSGVIPHLDYCIDTVGVRLIGVINECADIPASLYAGRFLPARSTIKKIFSNIAQRLEGNDVPPAIMDFE